MKLKEILEKFGGRKINLESMPHYQRWALGYFPTEKKIIDPNLYITLQLDITLALSTYKNHFSNTSGSSFTAYFIWKLVKAMSECEAFNYRYIDGEWYHLNDPPVFIPIATGKENRFQEIILEKTGKKTWETFVQEYRYRIQEALAGRGLESGTHDEDIFFLSTFIGNLPNIQFTSFMPKLHQTQTGRCAVYLGKRYQQEGKDFTPFSITLNHGNTDPYLLDILLQKLNSGLCQAE